MKRIAAIAVLAVLIISAAWQALWPKGPEVGLDQGNKAPEFSLPLINGNEAHLADYKGKKVIVNFWATWCPPCKEEIPELKEISAKHSDDLVVLAINYTGSEASEEAVRTFVDSHAMKFPVLMDVNSEVLSQYEVFSYPTTYFLDEEGIIQKVQRGMVDRGTLEEFADS
ncbi:TlpA family protein disulfide reductase [Metabacillus sp. 84]|uniref:TlpA family protein disulfide reductase n=1 Tax=Metabacillus sp. 84 TaxID=3404705 RepID=UPI003CF28811